MRVLEGAGVLTYLGLAGTVGLLVLNFLFVILRSIIMPGAAAIQTEAVAVEMSEVLELHHWLAYKAAGAQNGPEALYHVEKALALATDPKHRSELDGLMREHVPEGHFIHARGTLEDWLGDRHEPPAPLDLLHATLAHQLLEEGKMDEAREQVEHLVALATGPEKEQGQSILDALKAGDTQTATSLLDELKGRAPP